jgi:hypothetical protein
VKSFVAYAVDNPDGRAGSAAIDRKFEASMTVGISAAVDASASTFDFIIIEAAVIRVGSVALASGGGAT